MNDKAYKFSTRDSTEFTVGSGLPEVTAEDNGDVLTVVEGAWAKAAPTGTGSGVMVVDTEFGEPVREAAASPVILKKTWQEIYDALVAGTPVFMRQLPPEGSGVTGVMMHPIDSAVCSDEHYVVVVSLTMTQYTTSTADGYPASSGIQ